MSAPKFFKDFNKDTKDLLTKQYTAGSDWKLENKIKPDDKTFILNPGFESKKGKVRVSVDVDYNVKEYNIETKTTVYQDGGIKPKLTWKQGATKVEYTLANIELKSFPYSPESDFELTGETFVPAVGLALYDKFGAKDFEVGVSGSLFFLKNLTLGGSLNLEYPLAFKGWNAGLRYAQDGYIVNVTTAGLKSFTTGVFAPIAIAGVPVKLAAQVDCGAKKFDATVGVEAALSDVTVKAKVNTSFNVTIALIRKLTDKWTTAVTVNVAAAPSIGLSLTRE